MTEKLRVYGSFRNGTAVYCKIFSVSSPAVLVDDTGNILLTDAAFSGNQNRYIGRSNCNGNLQSPVERRIVADYIKLVF